MCYVGLEQRSWMREEWRYHAASVSQELVALQLKLPVLLDWEADAYVASFYAAEDRLADLQSAEFADGMPADFRARIAGLQEQVNRIAQAARRELGVEL